jgi:hypothetical protein
MDARIAHAITCGRKQVKVYPNAKPSEIAQLAERRAIEYGRDWATAWLQGVKAELHQTQEGATLAGAA